jgi:hypothetical protein
MSPLSVKKLPVLPVLGLVMAIVTIIHLNTHVLLSTIVPLTCIAILCIILTKRKIDQSQNPN